MASDAEAIAEDAEQYQCDTCPVAAASDGLEPENRFAWRIYQQIVTRLAADLHCGDTVLARLTGELDADDFDDCWARLRLLYDVLQPPPDPKG